MSKKKFIKASEIDWDEYIKPKKKLISRIEKLKETLEKSEDREKTFWDLINDIFRYMTDKELKNNV